MAGFFPFQQFIFAAVATQTPPYHHPVGAPTGYADSDRRSLECRAAAWESQWPS